MWTKYNVNIFNLQTFRGLTGLCSDPDHILNNNLIL